MIDPILPQRNAVFTIEFVASRDSTGIVGKSVVSGAALERAIEDAKTALQHKTSAIGFVIRNDTGTIVFRRFQGDP